MQILDENKNKPAITSKYVINNNSLITTVYYDEDGDWQFLGNENIKPEDAMVVSIEQMLKHDPTLAILPDLEIGQSAFRIKMDEKWQKRR